MRLMPDLYAASSSPGPTLSLLAAALGRSPVPEGAGKATRLGRLMVCLDVVSVLVSTGGPLTWPLLA